MILVREEMRSPRKRAMLALDLLAVSLFKIMIGI
jgi:hypothetical protein